MKIKNSLEEAVDSYGDDHVGSSSDNPVRPDAFELSNQEKIELIEEKVADILHILGMDLTDDSLKGTPNRVAKMYVDEIFSGLRYDTFPNVLLLRINFHKEKSLF